MISLAEIAAAKERGEISLSGLPGVKKFGKFMFQPEMVKMRNGGDQDALKTHQEGSDNKPYDFIVTLNPARRSGISVFIKRNHAGPSAHVGDVVDETPEDIWNPDGSLRGGFIREIAKERGVVLLEDVTVRKFSLRGDTITEHIQTRHANGPITHKQRRYYLDNGRPADPPTQRD
ncbi:MAG: hypothetical protein V1875_08315 [Candidatus Altiarchaeota archaeon]